VVVVVGENILADLIFVQHYRRFGGTDLRPSEDALEKLAEELLALEDKNLQAVLDPSERKRWVELTETLFAVPSELTEKRRYFRIQSTQSAKVLGPLPDPSATILSVSGGGLFVQTPSIPPLGSDVEIEVTLPSPRQEAVQFRGRVRWVSGGGDRAGAAPSGFGVSFVSLGADQRSAILSMIKGHVMTNLRLGVEKYRFFLDHSPDVTILLDRHNVIVDCNEHARVLLGLDSTSEFCGLALLPILATSAAQAVLAVLDFTRAQGESGRCEADFPRLSGQGVVRMDLATSAVRSSDIDLGVLIVGRDMTDRMKIEEQRRDLERRLYQADKLACLGQIAAGVAHDINNPLAWVLSNLSLLEQYEPAISSVVGTAAKAPDVPGGTCEGERLADIRDNVGDLIHESLDGVRRIRDIIRDLKTFSRVDVHQEEEVDINSALDVSVRIVRNQIQQRAHVVRDYAELSPTYVNYGKVSQVLLNLLTNAVKCFRTSEVDRNAITLRTREQGQAIVVSIIDNGPGIAAELRDKIFEPFFTHGFDGGTGLGLPIARDAARALGGDVQVQSEVGAGTTFSVTIPMRPRPSKRPSSGPNRATVRHRPGLLVVDDEPVLLRAFERFLRRRFDVVTASTATEALEALGRSGFEAVLCDVMMPDSTGLALLERVRALLPGVEERFIFMTGGVFGEQERMLLDKLPNLIIEKPLDMASVEKLLLEFMAEQASKA
jgi:PAS domain S-box-containing protein